MSDTEALQAVQRATLPVQMNAGRGVAQAPVVQPSPMPATALRRRVSQVARSLGLVAIPRTYVLPFSTYDGGASGKIEWQPDKTQGPIVVVGIDGLDETVLLSAGTYVASILVGGRVITQGEVRLGSTQAASLRQLLDATGELPAPIIIGPGERLQFSLAATGGTLVASASLTFRALVFVQPSRAPANPALASQAAAALRAEGELWVLGLSVGATTPNLEDSFRAQYPTVVHGVMLAGLGIAGQGKTFLQLMGFDVLVGNGVSAGLPQRPTTAPTFPYLGDVAFDVSETITLSMSGNNPDPAVTGNRVTAFVLGRSFR